MRNWRKRDQAVLAGRKGFVRFALQQQVPIVPVATVGGHDTVFVLSEGRFLAKWTGIGKRLRGATMPIVSGFPFPLAVEILPVHLPLPAKIRTELLEPIELDPDPGRSEDDDYVDSVYREVEARSPGRDGPAREAAQLPDLRLSEEAMTGFERVARRACRALVVRTTATNNHMEVVRMNKQGRSRTVAGALSALAAGLLVAAGPAAADPIRRPGRRRRCPRSRARRRPRTRSRTRRSRPRTRSWPRTRTPTSTTTRG